MKEKAGPLPFQDPVTLCFFPKSGAPNEQKICQGADAILCDYLQVYPFHELPNAR